MIQNLMTASAGQKLEADVVIIGGGTVGLVIAVLLSRKGLRVVVLESGQEQQTEDRHPLNEVIQTGAIYKGAEEGRFRCFGGTSTRWGGALIPFLPQDADPIAGWEALWPVGVEAFTRYKGDVERMFGVSDGPYEAPEVVAHKEADQLDFIPRLAKAIPVSNRNTSSLLRKELERESGPQIWLNATVDDFSLDSSGRLESVWATGLNGRLISVKAREVVIAAGAIESTRLLLLLDRRHGDKIFAPYNILGRFFHDHLAAATARVQVCDERALNRTAGIRFEEKMLRFLRFEPNPKLRKRLGSCTGFAHISFASHSQNGLDALRGIVGARQEGRFPSTGDLLLLASQLPWFTRAVWWRLVEKRLLYPPGAAHQLEMVIEQTPLARNRITLSSERLDFFGNPLAKIDWRPSDEDARNAAVLTEHFVRFWERSTLASMARFEIKPQATILDELASGGGVYHPGGSTRMGTDATTGVVDKNLQTFAISNLSVLSTSAFPTGGGANPTMMLLMAAFRLADRLTPRLVGTGRTYCLET